MTLVIKIFKVKRWSKWVDILKTSYKNLMIILSAEYYMASRSVTFLDNFWQCFESCPDAQRAVNTKF